MRVFLICPGNMVKNCPGNVGDVFIASSVARYLAQVMGYNVDFITNETMYNVLINTFTDQNSKISLSKTNAAGLNSDDLNKAPQADFIIILRSTEDDEAINWKNQLISKNINPDKIYFINNLNAFSRNGPHMAYQVLNEITNILHRLYPIVRIPEDIINDILEAAANKDTMQSKKQYLILPFAGDLKKWLSVGLVSRIINKLKQQSSKVLIIGTEYDKAKNSYYAKYEKKFGDKVYTIDDMAKVIPHVISSKEVITADSGLCWFIISCINWLYDNGTLNEKDIPLLKVITGRDNSGKPAPPIEVWKPLTTNSLIDKVIQINGEQKYKISKIPLKKII